MNRRLRAPIAAGILFILMLAIGACNVFEVTNDAEKPVYDQAEEHLREGDYDKAREVLGDAVADSTDAMALYLNSKIAVQEAEIDLARIVTLIESQGESDGDNMALLDLIDELEKAEQTRWYRANMEVKSNLTRIWRGDTEGILSRDDVALGYSVSSLLTAVLGIRDTNRDGIIDSSDFLITLSFITQLGQSAADGYEIDGGEFVDDQGQLQSFDGLSVFLGDWGAAKYAVGQGKTKYEPDDINPYLSFIISVMGDGVEGVIELLQNMGGTTFDPELIRENFDEVASVINYYWYDDNEDNDGDGVVDEEQINGIDDDGDGLVDEDTDLHPADPDTDDNANPDFIKVFKSWRDR
jgi:hypothetical protein